MKSHLSYHLQKWSLVFIFCFTFSCKKSNNSQSVDYSTPIDIIKQSNIAEIEEMSQTILGSKTSLSEKLLNQAPISFADQKLIRDSNSPMPISEKEKIIYRDLASDDHKFGKILFDYITKKHIHNDSLGGTLNDKSLN